MSRRYISVARGALACMVIACVLLVGITLASGIHQHSDTHCCDFCHFGFVAWMQSAAAPTAAPLLAREWRTSAELSIRDLDNSRIARCGRAPPAC